MLTIEELKLSPIPWSVNPCANKVYADVDDAGGNKITEIDSGVMCIEDARLMTASPNIYDKAYRVLAEFEKVVTRKPNGLTVIDCECSHLECAMDELREALSEAAGGNA